MSTETKTIRVTGGVERVSMDDDVEVELTEAQVEKYRSLEGDARIDFLRALLINAADFDRYEDDWTVSFIRVDDSEVSQ